MEKESECSGKNIPCKSEFALKYWIPVYGAVRAAFNFGKKESLFYDTASKMPLGKQVTRTAGQLIWLGYQGIFCLSALVAVSTYASKALSELETLLK